MQLRKNSQDHYPISKTIGVFEYSGKEYATKRQDFQFSLSAWRNDFVNKYLRVNTKGNKDPPVIQEYPPLNSKGFITKAVCPEFLNYTISLFRNHFSPDMSSIFPAIVYQKSGTILNFESTQTWVIFPQYSENTQIIKPAGSVSWRLHKPKMNMTPQNQVDGVLEVLFLAVMVKYRNDHFGRDMVDKLKVTAKENDCKILYVEIGMETPDACEFWYKNGFFPVSEKESPTLSEAQILFFEHNCLRFDDTEIWINILG